MSARLRTCPVAADPDAVRRADRDGVVRAAPWLPALRVGPRAGVLADRMPRRPVLIAADTVAALATGAQAALALSGRLTVPVLALLVGRRGVGVDVLPHRPPVLPAATGAAGGAAVAHPRVEQTTTAAERAARWWSVRWSGSWAPAAILVNAVSHTVAALCWPRSGWPGPAPERQPDRHLWRQLVEGGSRV